MRVVTMRSTHALPVHDPVVAAREGWCTLDASAQRLDVSPTVVRSLITRGVLPAQQVITGAPWVIQAADLETEEVQPYVARVHGGRYGPRIADAEQLSFSPPTT